MTQGSVNVLDSTATLRATGAFRFVSSAFLAVWLVGWAIGEVVALGGLGALIAAGLRSLGAVEFSTPARNLLTSGGYAFVLCFLLIWLTFWTIGGFAAMTHLLRSLAGEDRLRLQPEGLEFTRRAGPFRRVRVLDRARIRRIRIRHHDKALVADTASGLQLLSDLGSFPERDAVCTWLKDHLQLRGDDSLAARIDTSTAPPGWDAEPESDGSTRLRRRAQRQRPIQALIMWGFTALATWGWVGRLRADGFNGAAVGIFALILLLVAASAWLTWGRSGWYVQPGRLTFRRWFGGWMSEYLFEHARLEVECNRDSDGDDSYELVVRSGETRRTIQTASNDDGEVVECARWLAALTGFSLRIPRDVQHG